MILGLLAKELTLNNGGTEAKSFAKGQRTVRLHYI